MPSVALKSRLSGARGPERVFDDPTYIILTDFLMGFLAPGYQHRAQEDGI